MLHCIETFHFCSSFHWECVVESLGCGTAVEKGRKEKKSPLLRTWSSRFLLLSLEHIRIEPGMLCLLSGILLFWFLPSQLIQLHFCSPIFSHEVKCYSRLNDLYFTLMWSSHLTGHQRRISQSVSYQWTVAQLVLWVWVLGLVCGHQRRISQSVSYQLVDCCSACPAGMGAWIGVY